MQKYIKIKGARENNLKNVDLKAEFGDCDYYVLIYRELADKTYFENDPENKLLTRICGVSFFYKKDFRRKQTTLNIAR